MCVCARAGGSRGPTRARVWSEACDAHQEGSLREHWFPLAEYLTPGELAKVLTTVSSPNPQHLSDSCSLRILLSLPWKSLPPTLGVTTSCLMLPLGGHACPTHSPARGLALDEAALGSASPPLGPGATSLTGCSPQWGAKRILQLGAGGATGKSLGHPLGLPWV